MDTTTDLTQCHTCGEVINRGEATSLSLGRDYCPACAPYAIAAAALGRRGGRVKSERKSAAARANGRKGGRPKKGQQTA